MQKTDWLNKCAMSVQKVLSYVDWINSSLATT